MLCRTSEKGWFSLVLADRRKERRLARLLVLVACTEAAEQTGAGPGGLCCGGIAEETSTSSTSGGLRPEKATTRVAGSIGLSEATSCCSTTAEERGRLGTSSIAEQTTRFLLVLRTESARAKCTGRILLISAAAKKATACVGVLCRATKEATTRLCGASRIIGTKTRTSIARAKSGTWVGTSITKTKPRFLSSTSKKATATSICGSSGTKGAAGGVTGTTKRTAAAGSAPEESSTLGWLRSTRAKETASSSRFVLAKKPATTTSRAESRSASVLRAKPSSRCSGTSGTEKTTCTTGVCSETGGLLLGIGAESSPRAKPRAYAKGTSSSRVAMSPTLGVVGQSQFFCGPFLVRILEQNILE